MNTKVLSILMAIWPHRVSFSFTPDIALYKSQFGTTSMKYTALSSRLYSSSTSSPFSNSLLKTQLQKEYYLSWNNHDREFHLFMSSSSAPSTTNENENKDQSSSTTKMNLDDVDIDVAEKTTSAEPATKIGKRQSVLNLAKSIVTNGPISTAAAAVARPKAIGAILRDAAGSAAVELTSTTNNKNDKSIPLPSSSNNSLEELKQKTEYAFSNAEKSIQETQNQLNQMKDALQEAKLEVFAAIDGLEVGLNEAQEELDFASTTVTPTTTTTTATTTTSPTTNGDIFTDVEDLTYDDVDYEMSEMAPPFIGEDMCLVPGVPLVRVEKAPENSRRIFAGIDIMASVEDVWKLLTDYNNLQKIIPNLVTNEVLDLYPGDPNTHTNDYHEIPNMPSEIQCQNLAEKMKGARLKQVGGAKVVGINFSARTTLEVREWPEGMPDFAHYEEEVYGGESREQRIQGSKANPLMRYRFPRPFSISTLPSRAISMQSVVDDDGEFRIYQGVWRMQPLPGCSAPGTGSAMRLTYAVEISPRAYLPVRLVEGRIAQDLCTNLEAIRDFVTVTEA